MDEPRLVGDPVGDRVKATARDADERLVAHLPEVKGADLAVTEHRTRGRGLKRDPENSCEVVAPAARKDAEHALAVLDRVGDRSDQAVATERDRELTLFGRIVSEFLRMLKAPRGLHVIFEPQVGQRGADVVEGICGPAPTRLRVDDQRQHQPPVTSA